MDKKELSRMQEILVKSDHWKAREGGGGGGGGVGSVRRGPEDFMENMGSQE